MISFYQHDFSSKEVKEVVRVLKSPWVNSGPESEKFSKELKFFLRAKEIFLTSSAWSGLFLSLKAWGIESGDEIITTPYTFSATANVIIQNGAQVVFADIGTDYLISPSDLEKKITSKTKVIIPMDYGGYPCSYEKIHQIVERQKHLFKPKNPLQEKLGRILILGDGAHSFGSYPIPSSKKKRLNFLPDIYVYSFHTVKNITTGDGGAISLFNSKISSSQNFLRTLSSLISHGLTRNAFSQLKDKKIGYDIIEAGYKLNLTDLAAALGRVQLKRIEEFYQKKKKILERYNRTFSKNIFYEWGNNDLKKNINFFIHPHLYTLKGVGKSFKSISKKMEFIKKVAAQGVFLNVHYLPLPLSSFYKKLGFNIKDYPQCYEISKRHFSLPFYTKLTFKQMNFIEKVLFKNVS